MSGLGVVEKPFYLKPLGDWILVKLLPLASEKNGLVMVDLREAEWESKVPLEAEVVAAADFVNDVQEGDRVLINSTAGKWIGDDVTNDPSHTYRMVQENEVLAKVEPA